MSTRDDDAVRRGIVRDSMGVGIATGVYGISFGAISVASGLSITQTCLLSLLMFTGASQFALVGVIASGGSPLSGALTALLLGTRNTLYGLKLAGMLGLSGPRRVAGSHLVIDESTAMSVLRETREDARLGFAVWLSSAIELPFEGYVLGVLTGLLAAYVLLHDFSRPHSRRPIDPA